jgi:probable HAF family extracellular repeat protein
LGEDFCLFGTRLICLPFLWHDDVMTGLPTLGGNNGAAFDINNLAQAVGLTENATLDSTCATPQFQVKPVIWEKGTIQELPTATGDPDGYVNGINDKGQAVGGSGDCTIDSAFSLHALLWQHGIPTDLGNLGGQLYSGANAINARGQVIGSSDLAGDTNLFAGPFSNTHGFLWQNGVMTDVGTLPGDGTSFAFSINNKGQVVGLGSRAFLWQDGVMTDLNTLVPGPPFSPLYLLQAFDINTRGEVVGLGLASSGELHAFLAIPCDEDDADSGGCGKVAGVTPPAPGRTNSGEITQANSASGSRLGGMLDRPRGAQFPSRYFPSRRIGLRSKQ